MRTLSIIALSVLLLAACTTTTSEQKAAEPMTSEAIVAPAPGEVCAKRAPDDGTCLCVKLNAAGECEEGGGTVIIQGGGNNVVDADEMALDSEEVCAIRDPDDGTCLCKKVNAAGQCEEGGGTVIIQGGGNNMTGTD